MLDQLGTEYFENLNLEDISKLEKLDLHSVATIKQIDTHYELWQNAKDLFRDLLKNNISVLKKDLKKLTKEREKLSTFIFFLILLARHYQQTKIANEATPNEIEKWSIIINNLIQANYLILDRNINANYLLSDILLDVSHNTAQPITNYIN